jgi:hypothetical protein
MNDEEERIKLPELEELSYIGKPVVEVNDELIECVEVGP